MRTRSFKNDKGILYLVATPIGNLSDITYRAVEILKSVDVIYAEDTRNSIVLLNHYDIKTRLETYHEFNQDTKTEVVINDLKNGKNVAIISDAGLPIISDPGFKIVQEARTLGIPCSTIPGASAGISALVASGIAPMPYTFYGFLDSKKTKRIQELNDLKYVNHTLIFYEAPHRIFECLEDMREVFGDRFVVLARELTKTFEEYISGKISEVLKEENIKGEIVLIVEGYKESNSVLEDPYLKIDELISLGYKPIDAIKEVAKIYNLDRKELYKNYVQGKNNK
jgi:16S rRNA (cytidine1402-2'-O)-methyltransferase